MKGDDVFTVGVVLRRRRSNHPWQDHSWRATEVVVGVAPDDGWRLLRESDDEAYYLAGTRSLRLFRGETEGYRYNLSQRAPMIYVVLRPADDDPARPLRPFHVTVCPTEAQDYLDGDDTVDAVPMPPAIAAWVATFVRRHHVDRPFEKRGREARDERRRVARQESGKAPGGGARMRDNG